jgi:hypothetical protein
MIPLKMFCLLSNIDGKPDEKDGRGFISKISPVNGTIIELNWVTGLNAPKVWRLVLTIVNYMYLI